MSAFFRVFAKKKTAYGGQICWPCYNYFLPSEDDPPWDVAPVLGACSIVGTFALLVALSAGVDTRSIVGMLALFSIFVPDDVSLDISLSPLVMLILIKTTIIVIAMASSKPVT